MRPCDTAFDIRHGHLTDAVIGGDHCLRALVFPYGAHLVFRDFAKFGPHMRGHSATFHASTLTGLRFVRPASSVGVVLCPGNEAKVGRVEASPVLANMVNLQTVRNRPDPYGVRKPVREYLPPSLTTMQHPVPRVDAGGGGFPTTSIGDRSVMEQSIFVTKRSPNRLRYCVYPIALMESTHTPRPNLARAPRDRARPGRWHRHLDRCRVGIKTTLRHSVVGATQPTRIMTATAPRHLANSRSHHERHTTRKVHCYANCT